MRDKLKWLIVISAITVVVVVSLLVWIGTARTGVTGNTGPIPLTRLTGWRILAQVTIALLLLVIPTSHIAWLILAAIWLARTSPPPRQKCPVCGEGIEPAWKACPHCGIRLDQSTIETDRQTQR
jgi:hypothetical protein